MRMSGGGRGKPSRKLLSRSKGLRQTLVLVGLKSVDVFVIDAARVGFLCVMVHFN